MCKYCEFDDYAGDVLLYESYIDGKDQHIETYLIDDPEGVLLLIDGACTEIDIPIYFCPICGEKLRQHRPKII